MVVGVFSEVGDNEGCEGTVDAFPAEVGLVGASCMPPSTFRGLKGKSPALDHPDLIFREVKAMSRARLYSSVK